MFNITNKKSKIMIGKQTSIIISFIDKVIKENIPNIEKITIVEPFAKSGGLSKTYKKKCRRVIVSDIQSAYLPFLKNYIENNLPIFGEQSFCDNITKLAIPKNGFLSKYFTNNNYLTLENANIIDSIIETITYLKSKRRIKMYEYWFLLCSLMESTNKVLFKEKKFKLIASTPNIDFNPHKSYNLSVNKLLGRLKNKYELLYLNPPQSKKELSNPTFNLYDTITRYDSFIPINNELDRPNKFKSSWLISSKETYRQLRKALAFRNYKYVIYSHNSKNEMVYSEKHLKTIKKIMSEYGEYKFYSFNSKNGVIEYVHFIEVKI